MENKKNIILGGGLSGISCAYFFKNLGLEYLLFEKNKNLGGLCRTEITNKGFLYDYTGHLLHFRNDEVKNLILTELLKDNIAEHFRRSFIYIKDKYVRYPFQKNLYDLPLKMKLECFMNFLLNFSDYKLEENFKAWSMKNFGKSISKYFMIPYNEKLWQIPADKLSISWMKGYVPKPSFFEVLKSTFFSQKDNVGYNSKFYYPKQNGISALIDALKNRLDENKIKTNSEITEIFLQDKTYTLNGIKHGFDNLITTAPLKNLILNIIKDCDENIRQKALKLQATNVLNINLGLKRKVSDKHWIYFPDNKFIFYRCGFLDNFSDMIKPVIYTEVATKDNIVDFQKLTDQVILDLIKAKIIDNEQDIDEIKIFNIIPAYVIYDENRDEIVAEILQYLKSKNIYSIGRYGKWEYSAMEDAILDAKKTAEEIFKNE